GPFLRILADPAGLLTGLIADPAGPLLGLFRRSPGLGAGQCRVRRGLARLVLAAGGTRGPGQLLAEAAYRLPDVFLDLPDDIAHRVGQFLLELGQLVLAVPQFLAARLGDPVDLPPVQFVVWYPAFLFQPGQPRVDRPGRRGVHAHELIPQHPDHLIAVPGLLVEEPEQVEPEPAVAENRTHRASPFVCASSWAPAPSAGGVSVAAAHGSPAFAAPSPAGLSRAPSRGGPPGACSPGGAES